MNTNNYSVVLAAKEFLSEGGRLTRLEGLVLFGLADIATLATHLRKQGWTIKSQRIPYVRALVRLNKLVKVEVPKNLPVKELQLTEYWLSK